MSPSATPAAQNEGRCHQVPQSVATPAATKRATRPSPVPQVRKTKVNVSKRHACHAKPRATQRPSAPPEPAQCHKCTACHAKRRWMSPSATAATENEGGCEQAPRLPRKSAAPPRATNGDQTRHQSQPSATRATPATPNAGRCRQAPHLPHKTKVDVSKCHARRRPRRL